MKLCIIGVVVALFLAACGTSQDDRAEKKGELQTQLERDVPLGSSEEQARTWFKANGFRVRPSDTEEGTLVAVGRCFPAKEWYCNSWCPQVTFDLNEEQTVTGRTAAYLGDCL